MLRLLNELIFPPKCVICKAVLASGHVDLCPNCRKTIEAFSNAKNKFSFIAGWTSLWYYRQEPVRESLRRYKFCKYRSYATNYGRLLAMKLLKENWNTFDLLTWVPVSALRRFTRTYDQSELLAEAVGRELNVKPIRTLKKIRNNNAQSLIHDHAQRRANVIGAYRVPDPVIVRGKRILLLDDVVTSGSTASECAKMLMIAGAKEVWLATIASAVKQ